MRKAIIALILILGLTLLISGAVVFAFSQEKIPSEKKIGTLYEKAYTAPYPIGPSFELNLTQGTNFTVAAPTLAYPPGYTGYVENWGYIEILAPNNTNIVNSTTDYWDYQGQTGRNWQAQLVSTARVCAYNSSIPIYVNGTYTFKYSTEYPNGFRHIIIYETAVEPEKFPNLYLQNPSLALMAGGGIITAIGVLTGLGLPKRKRRLRARKPSKTLS